MGPCLIHEPMVTINPNFYFHLYETCLNFGHSFLNESHLSHLLNRDHELTFYLEDFMTR